MNFKIPQALTLFQSRWNFFIENSQLHPFLSELLKQKSAISQLKPQAIPSNERKNFPLK